MLLNIKLSAALGKSCMKYQNKERIKIGMITLTIQCPIIYKMSTQTALPDMPILAGRPDL